ncbi:MAG TPA: hypothetical protein VKV96_02420 [Roseiarcus sp.]|nr:hypothetical protein [Roseiarcus sp.]
MNAARWKASLAPCAGLAVAPALWALNTQLGEILPYAECRSGAKLDAMASLPAFLLALAAGFVSWRFAGWRENEASKAGAAYPATVSFIGQLGALAAALFAFALLLQSFAALVISGCAR